jgi:hypothetical protein
MMDKEGPMITIRNKLNQRLTVHLTGTRHLHLPAGDIAVISEEDFSAPHLQTLIARGDVFVIKMEQTEKEKTPTVTKTVPTKVDPDKAKADQESRADEADVTSSVPFKPGLSAVPPEEKPEVNMGKPEEKTGVYGNQTEAGEITATIEDKASGTASHKASQNMAGEVSNTGEGKAAPTKNGAVKRVSPPGNKN